jgi:hypothetical protein
VTGECRESLLRRGAQSRYRITPRG